MILTVYAVLSFCVYMCCIFFCVIYFFCLFFFCVLYYASCGLIQIRVYIYHRPILQILSFNFSRYSPSRRNGVSRHSLRSYAAAIETTASRLASRIVSHKPAVRAYGDDPWRLVALVQHAHTAHQFDVVRIIFHRDPGLKCFKKDTLRRRTDWSEQLCRNQRLRTYSC